MTVTNYMFGITSSALMLVVVVQLLRRHRLRERHTIWWIVAGLFALVASTLPATLDWVAGRVGIDVPSDLASS